MQLNKISVRDLSEQDIPQIIKYWFHSPPGFIEAMGADPAKLPTENEMNTQLVAKCRENQTRAESKINALAILCDNQPVGFHTLFPIEEGDCGIFHAHLWDMEMRRKGIAFHSYPAACKVFMNRFNLKRILFKTPKQNTGAIRVKEKLNIRCIGEEAISFGIIKAGTIAKVFELTKEELLLHPSRSF